MMNEADTRVKLIDPKLHDASWTEDNILRDRSITPGRILNEDGARKPGKKPDYMLMFEHSFPIAVVEAKDEGHTPLDGMQQANEYARDLDVLFAYSTNGKGIEEFDFTTKKQSTIEMFPTPAELWGRYTAFRLKDLRLTFTKNPLETPSYYEPEGKKPWYFQEAATRRVIEALLKAQKRILIAMATGTGKTYIAFQTIWKLYQAGIIRRVLYIADRIILRDQAFNTFAPFGDGRAVIAEGKVPKNKDIYFTTYQSLFSGEPGKQVFQQYDSRFFDVIVIDECHRSGFGTWHDIMKHFSSAYHLGMTATPKRDDNIDTYAYFGNAVYTYSLGKGIEDGFLAPYKIHKVFTNIDKQGGISLKDVDIGAAKIFVPPDVSLKEYYTSGQFEREIALPDRTRKICEHLANLLRIFEPMKKTMVFCVTNEHASQVAKELQNRFSDFGYSDYAVRIVSEEHDVRPLLERFVDSDKKTPVVAATVDLLSTGVDAPSVHNIVFLKPISSKVLLKQIVGRGSRVDPNTKKFYFRIIDYVDATRLFDDWDYPDGPETVVEPKGPMDRHIAGAVVDTMSGESIPNASVSAVIGPNQQVHARTDEDGHFSFEGLPRTPVKLQVSATGFTKREFVAQTTEGLDPSVVVELKPEPPKREKITIEGLNVFVAEETYVEIEEGKVLASADYVEYSKEEVKKRVVSLVNLKKIWLNKDDRERFLSDLKDRSVNPEVISKLIERPDADTFDVIAHVAFGAPIISRDERARALLNLKAGFVESFGPEARQSLLDLLDKYRLGGVEEIAKPEVFRVPPFDKRGYIAGVAKQFGGIQGLKRAIDEVQRGLYHDFEGSSNGVGT